MWHADLHDLAHNTTKKGWHTRPVGLRIYCGLNGKDVLAKVEDTDAVADGTQHRVSIRSEDEIAARVDAAAQVWELQKMMHT